jgi:predicted nucleic acid-binding protein
MKYLLGTCVISEFTKLQPNSHVLTWLEATQSDNLFLSVITIGEIKKGIYKLPVSSKKQALLLWITSLLGDYQNRVLPVDLDVIENWSAIIAYAEKNGQPVASMDGLIAATAYAHHLTLVTRNERDFAACNITMINPWHD